MSRLGLKYISKNLKSYVLNIIKPGMFKNKKLHGNKKGLLKTGYLIILKRKETKNNNSNIMLKVRQVAFKPILISYRYNIIH